MNWHPLADLSAYLDGELTLQERKVVEQHLAGCERCRLEMEMLGGMKASLRGLGMLTPERALLPTPAVHPGESMTAYLDGELDPLAALGVEAHIEACPNCARELKALHKTRSALRGLPWLEEPKLDAITPGALRAPRRDAMLQGRQNCGVRQDTVASLSTQSPMRPMRHSASQRRHSVLLAVAAAVVVVIGFVGVTVPNGIEPKVQPDLRGFASNHASFAPSPDGVSGAATAVAFYQQP